MKPLLQKHSPLLMMLTWVFWNFRLINFKQFQLDVRALPKPCRRFCGLLCIYYLNYEDFKYTTSFSSVIKPLVSEEKTNLATSHVDIGDFVPDVNTDKHIDLLPIAFNAFVTNRVNKNGDAVDTETGAMYKDFINKPINIEHNRKESLALF